MNHATPPNATARSAGAVTLSRLLLTCVPGVIAVSAMWHLHIMNRKMSSSKADLVPVWTGARAALQGQNPYSDETTRQIQVAYYGRALRPGDDVNPMAFAYPAHTLVLFSVLAPFSWPVVRLSCLILLPLLTALSIPLWIRVLRLQMAPRGWAITLLLGLASWPVMWAVHQIQPTLVVAALIAAGCFLLQRGNGAAAGILFAMATVKPQLVGPLLAWLCLWSLLRRQWGFLASFALTLSVLLACATWLSPGWIAGWRAAMVDYAHYRHLQPDLQFLLGRWPGGALGLVVAGATVFALWRHRRTPADGMRFGAMCALALSATVCLLPNEMSMIYNHVLLLPACLAVVFLRPASGFGSVLRRIALVQLLFDFAAVVIAALGETLTGPRNVWDALPFLDFLLPLLLTAVLLIENLGGRPAESVTVQSSTQELMPA